MSNTEQMREAIAKELNQARCHEGRVVGNIELTNRIMQAIASLTAPAAEVPAQIERKVYKGSAEHSAYLSARFAPEHRAGISFEWDGHRWAYRYTSFDDSGEYDLLWRPVPAATAAEVPEQSTRLRGGVPDVDAICYLATEIRFAKTDDAAQAVIDKIRAMLTAAPQAPAAALDAGVVRDAVQAEREACAELCDLRARICDSAAAYACAADIRSRSNAAMSAQAGKGGAA